MEANILVRISVVVFPKMLVLLTRDRTKGVVFFVIFFLEKKLYLWRKILPMNI